MQRWGAQRSQPVQVREFKQVETEEVGGFLILHRLVDQMPQAGDTLPHYYFGEQLRFQCCCEQRDNLVSHAAAFQPYFRGAIQQSEEAIGAYKEAIRLNQKQVLHWPWPSMSLGTLLLRLERLNDAEAALRDSLKIDPRFPVAHLRLAQVLDKQEQSEKAIAEVEEAARLEPTYPEPHYILAGIYRRRQDLKSAQKESKMFQELRNADKLKGITRPD